LISAEEDGIGELYVKELRRTVQVSEWLDGIETKEERLRKKGNFDERQFPPNEKGEDNSALLHTQSELTKLKNDKDELEPLKLRLDDRADVWGVGNAVADRGRAAFRPWLFDLLVYPKL